MIIRNSAKCTACGEEIESTHRHDFVVHFCEKEPTQLLQWTADNKLEPVPGKTTWRFAVDGGNAYLKRSGEGFKETSTYDRDVLAE